MGEGGGGEGGGGIESSERAVLVEELLEPYARKRFPHRVLFSKKKQNGVFRVE